MGSTQTECKVVCCISSVDWMGRCCREWEVFAYWPFNAVHIKNSRPFVGVHELWMCLKCFFTVILLKLFLWQMKSMHFYWGQPENFHINTIFLSQPWSSVSTLAKSFIDRLLTFDPEDRMTAEEALKHPWLVSMAACSSNKNLHRSISRNLQRRASRASSRCSGSAPSSRLGMRPRSRPGSAPRLGFGNKSQCSLKVASWYFDVLDSVLWCTSTVFFQIEQMFEGVKT